MNFFIFNLISGVIFFCYILYMMRFVLLDKENNYKHMNLSVYQFIIILLGCFIPIVNYVFFVCINTVYIFDLRHTDSLKINKKSFLYKLYVVSKKHFNIAVFVKKVFTYKIF